MLYVGQQVKRIIGKEDCFPSVGSVGFVATVLNEVAVTLVGCGDTPYLKSHFEPSGSIKVKDKDIKGLIEAIQVIDAWNTTCPSSQLISIEGHVKVDGGSVYMVGGAFDTNNPQELFGKLVQEVSKSDFEVQLAQLNTLAGKII